MSALRKLVYGAALISISLLCMAVAFTAVRMVGGTGARRQADTESARAQSESMRAMANELAQLTTLFLDEARKRPINGEEAFFSWLERDYKPALNDLRRRLLATRLPDTPSGVLLAALDRVMEMAANPDRADLRVIATDQVLEANTTVETYLSPLNTNDTGADSR